MVDPILIIAEVGQAHDGSLGMLHSYIDAVASTGVDAIKFQTHIADAESSVYEPFRIPFSYQDETRFAYWKRMEFNRQQWASIKEHCNERDLEFISSPFSNAAVDLLESLNVKRYKIGSGEVSNLLMLEKIAQTGKSVILSTGMSDYAELDHAVNVFRSHGNHISILQCTSKYPSGPADIGLNVIREMKNRYALPIGISDHSGTIYPSIAAATLGAAIIEVHVVFDKKMFGPDSTSSLTISELRNLTDGVRFVQAALNSPVEKNSIDDFREMKTIFGKSLAVNKDLESGYVIQFGDLEAKKPADHGIPSRLYVKVVGRKLTRDMKAYEFLNDKDIE